MKQCSFSKIFGDEAGKLRWVETKRYGPKEFFGKKPDEELDPELFEGRIPHDIGEAFNYRLQAPGVEVGFGQDYWNCIPLTTQQYLLFFFGQKRNPQGRYDNPLGEAEGFDFLRDAMMGFYRGRFGSPKTRITMESQNLGVHREGEWGKENIFTDIGKAVMLDFILQKGNILRIAGILDREHNELEGFLDLIENTYNEGRLEPRDVYYT